MRVILTPPRRKSWHDVSPRPIDGTGQTWLPDNKKAMTIWENQLPLLQKWAKEEGVGIEVTDH